MCSLPLRHLRYPGVVSGIVSIHGVLSIYFPAENFGYTLLCSQISLVPGNRLNAQAWLRDDISGLSLIIINQLVFRHL